MLNAALRAPLEHDPVPSGSAIDPGRPLSLVEEPTEIEQPPVWHAWLTSFRVWAPLMHALCFLAIFTGVSTRALVLGIVLYWLRMFGMTGAYHRYFSHRTYKTSRAF